MWNRNARTWVNPDMLGRIRARMPSVAAIRAVAAANQVKQRIIMSFVRLGGGLFGRVLEQGASLHCGLSAAYPTRRGRSMNCASNLRAASPTGQAGL